jgi:hypothetical protein
MSDQCNVHLLLIASRVMRKSEGLTANCRYSTAILARWSLSGEMPFLTCLSVPGRATSIVSLYSGHVYHVAIYTGRMVHAAGR